MTVKNGFPANSLIGKELGILDNHIVENQLRRNYGGTIPDSQLITIKLFDKLMVNSCLAFEIKQRFMQKTGLSEDERGISVTSNFDCLKPVYKTDHKVEPKWWSCKVRFPDSKRINLDAEEEYLSKRKKIPKDV